MKRFSKRASVNICNDYTSQYKNIDKPANGRCQPYMAYHCSNYMTCLIPSTLLRRTAHHWVYLSRTCCRCDSCRDTRCCESVYFGPARIWRRRWQCQRKHGTRIESAMTQFPSPIQNLCYVVGKALCVGGAGSVSCGSNEVRLLRPVLDCEYNTIILVSTIYARLQTVRRRTVD